MQKLLEAPKYISTDEILSSLLLTIELNKSEYNGLLNLNAVFLTLNGKTFPLDTSFIKTTKNANDTYTLQVTFNRSKSDTQALFSTFFTGQFHYTHNIEQLADPSMTGWIDLTIYNCLYEDRKINEANIKAITSMRITSSLNPSISIPINHKAH